MPTPSAVPPHWFCRERASAYAIPGDDSRVLEELAHCIRNGQVDRWWYLAGHDPLYAHLRRDPRFQALDRLATSQRDRQRALHAAMQREDARRLAMEAPARQIIRDGQEVAGPMPRCPDRAPSASGDGASARLPFPLTATSRSSLPAG